MHPVAPAPKSPHPFGYHFSVVFQEFSFLRVASREPPKRPRKNVFLNRVKPRKLSPPHRREHDLQVLTKFRKSWILKSFWDLILELLALFQQKACFKNCFQQRGSARVKWRAIPLPGDSRTGSHYQELFEQETSARTQVEAIVRVFAWKCGLDWKFNSKSNTCSENVDWVENWIQNRTCLMLKLLFIADDLTRPGQGPATFLHLQNHVFIISKQIYHFYKIICFINRIHIFCSAKV